MGGDLTPPTLDRHGAGYLPETAPGSGSPLPWPTRNARTSSTSWGLRKREKLTMPLCAFTPCITTELKSADVVIRGDRLDQEATTPSRWRRGRLGNCR